MSATDMTVCPLCLQDGAQVLLTATRNKKFCKHHGEILDTVVSPPPRIIPGVHPGTIVAAPEYASYETMVGRIRDSLTNNGDLLSKYHELWYNCGHTWPYNQYLGVGMMKAPNDLWMYQILMSDYRPSVVVETGTYQGASALWFATLMDMLGIADGRVFTVDFEDHRRNKMVLHPRITFLAGNSVDENLVAAISAEIGEDERVLVSLDSDHTEAHVKREMELYAPLCGVGDYLIVEDTNIGWSDGIDHKVVTESTQWGTWGRCTCGIPPFLTNTLNLAKVKCPHDRNERGARGGVETYLKAHEGEFMQDLTCERFLLTMNPGGWLRRVSECHHDR